MATPHLQGPSVARVENVCYSCPCGVRFQGEVVRGVELQAGAPAWEQVSGLNRLFCPACGAAADVQVSVVIHDLDAQRLVLYLPHSLRHRELEERAGLLQLWMAQRCSLADYLLEPRVVFGWPALRELLEAEGVGGAAPLAVEPSEDAENASLRVEELPGEAAPIDPSAPAVESPLEVTDERPTGRHALARPTPGTPAGEPAPSALSDPEAGPAEAARARPPESLVPNLRKTYLDRWIAGREGPAAFVIEQRILVAAALPSERLERLVEGPIELRVQLHRMPTCPVVGLLFIGAERAAGRSGVDEHRTLLVPLEMARAAHRAVLDALSRRTEITLELYDTLYEQVSVHLVAAPLEENVRRVMVEARRLYERLPSASRSFERARAALFHPTYDRLGRTPVHLPLSEEELEALERPSVIVSALASASRWSEPSAEAYLLEIRSVPLVAWSRARAAIISRALEAGIAVHRALFERAQADARAQGLDWGHLEWPAVVGQLIDAFSALVARRGSSDLSPSEESENWARLLHECQSAGVRPPERASMMAELAARRARVAAQGGADLRSLSSAELIALLEEKEPRLEAALLLAERGDADALPAIFTSLRRSPRGEASLVLPSLTAYGPRVEPYLLDGLRSKKAYLRQGCALALAVIASPRGIEALVGQLLDEPTEIWTEVARALGDVGPLAVDPLTTSLGVAIAAGGARVDENRLRVAVALGQIGARRAAGHDALLRLVKEEEGAIAEVARIALGQVAELRSADEAVRAGAGTGGRLPEGTVVRGFSRTFYEALRSGVGPLEVETDELIELTDEETDGAPPAGARKPRARNRSREALADAPSVTDRRRTDRVQPGAVSRALTDSPTHPLRRPS